MQLTIFDACSPWEHHGGCSQTPHPALGQQLSPSPTLMRSQRQHVVGALGGDGVVLLGGRRQRTREDACLYTP